MFRSVEQSGVSSGGFLPRYTYTVRNDLFREAIRTGISKIGPEELFFLLYRIRPALVAHVVKGMDLGVIKELLEVRTRRSLEEFISIPIRLKPSICLAFNEAGNLASRVRHKEAGCSELLIALLKVCKDEPKINMLIRICNINPAELEREFIEGNLRPFVRLSA